MAGFVRRSLALTHQGLTRVNRGLEHLLSGKPSRRHPFVRGLAEAYDTGWAECPCVFVLSTGRVGTTTLSALLALSPDVMATHEPEPRLVRAAFDAYMEGGDLGRSEKWRAVVLAARDDAVCSAARRGRIYVETNPKLNALASVLAACFPASRFIFLHRHPYEVVRSAVRRGHWQGHNWDFARIRPRPDEPDAQAWDGWSPLEKSAWWWTRVNSALVEYLASLPGSRKLVFRADRLFAREETALEELFTFVGVEPPPADRMRAVLGRKINAQRTGSYPPPAEWSEEERRMVWSHVGDVATALGYGP